MVHRLIRLSLVCLVVSVAGLDASVADSAASSGQWSFSGSGIAGPAPAELTASGEYPKGAGGTWEWKPGVNGPIKVKGLDFYGISWSGFGTRINAEFGWGAVDGYLETMTDGDGHKTTYTYDADNEPIKVEAPNGTVTETGYDALGQVTSQTDGRKHTTKYVRNALEEVTEVIDPLGRKTSEEYDKAGNSIKVTDAEKRTTSYTYDAANRLKEVSYSDGKTPAVKYEYNENGDRIKMIDGTGTTTYAYDQLGRLTETKNGNKEAVKYEYDLANEQTKITYPNGKSVTRAFDKAGRLQKVTDWLENTTQFAYNGIPSWVVRHSPQRRATWTSTNTTRTTR